MDTVARGAVVDRCCGCAVPGMTNGRSPICRNAEKPKKNNHWHCIREKNTFLHVECDDSDCDICELRQRAATFDACDSSVMSRGLLGADDSDEDRFHVREEPAGMIKPASKNVVYQ